MSTLKPASALGALAFVFLLPSCFVMTHDYDGNRELTPGTTLSRPSEELGYVDGSKKATFLLFGLIPLNDGSGAQLAEDLALEKYENFDGITRIKIHEEAGPLDVIVNALVGIIFSMQSVEVRGDVQRFPGMGGAR